MSWYNANLEKSCVYGALRFKMYRDLQELYKKYLAGDLGGAQKQPPGEPPCGKTFCERFESEWLSLNTYVSQFGETFTQQWFNNNTHNNIFNETFDEPWYQLPSFDEFVYGEEFKQQWFNNNTFINEYEDEFQIQWFICNSYINLDNENFEGEDWDE